MKFMRITGLGLALAMLAAGTGLAWQGKDNKKRLEGWEIQLLKDLSPTYLVRSVDNSPSRLLRTRHVRY
jgi:hypothetical protein